MAALDIAVDDKSDLGECKAFLSTYYMNLNASKSEVEEVGRSAAKSTAKGGALFRTIRARGVLLKNALSPQKVPGIHWKAHPKPGLALMTESLKSLMALISKAWTDRDPGDIELEGDRNFFSLIQGSEPWRPPRRVLP